MSPIQMNSYVADTPYDVMLDRLIAAPSNPGHDLRTTIIEILGDAGIWPIRCLEDRLDEKLRRRARGLVD